jgi:hypothetical protein
MRYFQPKGGFPEKHVIGIDENGMSHAFNADGSDRPVHTIEDHTRRALPVWTLEELENLVRDGSWEEVQGMPQQQSQAAPSPASPQPAAQPDRLAEPQPAAQTDARGDKPSDQQSGNVHPFPGTK